MHVGAIDFFPFVKRNTQLTHYQCHLILMTFPSTSCQQQWFSSDKHQQENPIIEHNQIYGLFMHMAIVLLYIPWFMATSIYVTCSIVPCQVSIFLFSCIAIHRAREELPFNIRFNNTIKIIIIVMGGEVQ